MRDWLDWPPAPADAPKQPRFAPAHGQITLLGSGIVGACLAQQLAQTGFEVNIYGRRDGSSGRIPALLVRRYPERQPSPSHRLYQHAFASAQIFYARHCPQSWAGCTLDTPTGQQTAGVLQGRQAIDELLAHPRIHHSALQVQAMRRIDDHWQLKLSDNSLSDHKTVLLCTAKPLDWLNLHAPVQPCAGQVIDVDKALEHSFSDRIHGIARESHSQIGSSYRPGDAQAIGHPGDSQALLQQAQALQTKLRDARIIGEHAAVRHTSQDHLPLIGPAPDMALWAQRQQQHENCRHPADKPSAPYLPGLWLNLAHGSRGATMAPLAGQLLCNALLGQTKPLEADLLKAIHPGRFATKAVRRGEL